MVDEHAGPAPAETVSAEAPKRELRQGDLVTHPEFPGSRGFVCGPNYRLKVVWRDSNSHPLRQIAEDLELLLAEDEFPGKLIEAGPDSGPGTQDAAPEAQP